MTKKVWNIDANLRNADWLKTTTWDLPTDKTAFIAHLASINKTVTEFMALPAAEAMPDTLKRDLAPDQLDDIHRALEGLTGVLGSGTKSLESKVRHVRDSEYWGAPVGTPLPLAGRNSSKLKKLVDRDAFNSFITETFPNAPKLDAQQARSKRTGWMRDIGHSRRLWRPTNQERLSMPDDGPLGPEFPARLRVVDHGDDPDGRGLAQLMGVTIGEEPIDKVYRGMSVSEWERAKERGYIQSDMRGAISQSEGTNFGIDPRTAFSYLPVKRENAEGFARNSDGKGVVVEIQAKPEHNYFGIIPDEYVRTREPIPISDVTTVSPIIQKDETGTTIGFYPDSVDEPDDQQTKMLDVLASIQSILGMETKVRHVRTPSAWPGNPPIGTPLPLPASFTSPSATKPSSRSVRKPASARYAEYPSARFAEIQNRVEDLQTQIEEIEEAHDPEWNSFSDAVTKRGRALQKQQDKLRDEEQKKREDFYKAVFRVIDRTDSASGKNTPAYDAGRDLYVVNDGATLKRNRALRAGRSPSPAVIKIDKMIAESTVKQNVMLYRMAVLSPDSIRKLRVGAVMRDRAFQSTGLAVSDAMAYADVRLEQSNERGKKVVLFNMRVPKGSNAVDVGYGEVVLPRNTEMKIIGIRREKITHYGDTYNTVIVDVEVTTP